MKQYLLSVYQAGDEPPPPEVLDPIMRDLDALNQEIKAAATWRAPATGWFARTCARRRSGSVGCSPS